MRSHFPRDGVAIPVRAIALMVTFAIGLLLSGCVSSMEQGAQCYYTAKAMQQSLPTGETFMLNVNTKDGNRLDIYFEIPYSRIHFEKDADVFKASYTASFVLRDQSGEVVRTNDVDRTVVARSYAESISSLHDAFLKMFYVPPGEYALDILVLDNRTHAESHRRLRVGVKNFPKENFFASDYLLFKYTRPGQREISLRPIFPSELSYVRDSIGMFQEIYNLRRGDTVRLSLTYSISGRHDTADTKLVSYLPPYYLRMLFCMRAPDSIYYRSDSVFVSPADGVIQVFQYFPKLAEGVTTLTRKIYLNRGGTIDSTFSVAKFPVYTPSFPYLDGIQEEIAAISYIARPEEVDSIRAGASPDEQVNRLGRFWEDHGGRERRKEFRDRVKEANELFSTCTEGWKTPMGISYIVCGPPDNIDCQGLLNEVWYYDIGGNASFAIPFRQSFELDNERYFEIIPYSVNDLIWDEFVNRWRRQ
ncbi:MAG: GWxTD domain-containing protein [Bacteroidota bacterium]